MLYCSLYFLFVNICYIVLYIFCLLIYVVLFFIFFVCFLVPFFLQSFESSASFFSDIMAQSIKSPIFSQTSQDF